MAVHLSPDNRATGTPADRFFGAFSFAVVVGRLGFSTLLFFHIATISGTG
jgi:hypothetical protein